MFPTAVVPGLLPDESPRYREVCPVDFIGANRGSASAPYLRQQMLMARNLILETFGSAMQVVYNAN